MTSQSLGVNIVIGRGKHHPLGVLIEIKFVINSLIMHVFKTRWRIAYRIESFEIMTTLQIKRERYYTIRFGQLKRLPVQCLRTRQAHSAGAFADDVLVYKNHIFPATLLIFTIRSKDRPLRDDRGCSSAGSSRRPSLVHYYPPALRVLLPSHSFRYGYYSTWEAVLVRAA